jgi:hypothetical protein
MLKLIRKNRMLGISCQSQRKSGIVVRASQGQFGTAGHRKTVRSLPCVKQKNGKNPKLTRHVKNKEVFRFIFWQT